MALIGNMIATAYAGNPSIVNYSMFVSVFSMLSLFYLIPATIKDGLGVPIAVIALDLLNVIFYFCAAVALAAYLGAHSCSNSVRTCPASPSHFDANTRVRAIRTATPSPTVLETPRNVAVRRRLPPPSSGLVSPAFVPLPSSRGSRAAEASTCVVAAVLRP